MTRYEAAFIGSTCRNEEGLYGVIDRTIRKSDMVSYRLSIVTIALSLTIRPQFAVECLRRSNQKRSIWVKILEYSYVTLAFAES